MIFIRANTQSINLPNPRWSNSHKVALRQIFKRSMLGTIHSFVRRPSYDVIEMDFELTRYELLHLMDFAVATAGELMYFYDHNNNIWYGNIINPKITGQIPGKGSGSDTRKERALTRLMFEGNKLT